MSYPENVAGMARFGINQNATLGVPMPKLRKLAREIDRDHPLALKLTCLQKQCSRTRRSLAGLKTKWNLSNARGLC
jgi:3-methyladenine DNA glycosylase AlkD